MLPHVSSVALADPSTYITPVLRQLHWLPVRQRIEFKMAVLVYIVQGTERLVTTVPYGRLSTHHNHWPPATSIV